MTLLSDFFSAAAFPSRNEWRFADVNLSVSAMQGSLRAMPSRKETGLRPHKPRLLDFSGKVGIIPSNFGLGEIAGDQEQV